MEDVKNKNKLQKDFEEMDFLAGEQFTIDQKLNRKKKTKAQKFKDIFEVSGLKVKNSNVVLGPITNKPKEVIPAFNYKLK